MKRMTKRQNHFENRRRFKQEKALRIKRTCAFSEILIPQTIRKKRRDLSLRSRLTSKQNHFCARMGVL
jgi:hypothetical protein